MFDVTSRVTHKNVPRWHQDLTRVCGHIPIVLCGNKVESTDKGRYTRAVIYIKNIVRICALGHRSIMPKQIFFHREKNLPYYDISIKSKYNIEKPFLYLIRKLTGYVYNLRSTNFVFSDPSCRFIEQSALELPSLQLDQVLILRIFI